MSSGSVILEFENVGTTVDLFGEASNLEILRLSQVSTVARMHPSKILGLQNWAKATKPQNILLQEGQKQMQPQNLSPIF